jgi:hypothetical protein
MADWKLTVLLLTARAKEGAERAGVIVFLAYTQCAGAQYPNKGLRLGTLFKGDYNDGLGLQKQIVSNRGLADVCFWHEAHMRISCREVRL